ncbi:hypothetical protein [Cloacibacillus porcorum]|uniref:hypothetical protein n=1 Tax=Cloacibacillus porcorum TaxID=1197717 RepID=UPI003D02FB46
MTREFEKYFPLPWKIVRREVAYEQGYGETFYSLCLGGRVIPFVHLEGGSRNNEEKALFVALEYLTACANLMPEAERLLRDLLYGLAWLTCEEDKKRELMMLKIKVFLAKLEGGGGDA